MRVLVQDRPRRTLALATDDYTLVFHHVQAGTDILPVTSNSSNVSLPGASKQASAPRCMVGLVPTAKLDAPKYRLLGSGRGTLGLITLNQDVFICIVTSSNEVATVRPEETVQNICAVEFCKYGPVVRRIVF